jgi:response regulator RpfG family c-di-GMP phosphodiesterase
MIDQSIHTDTTPGSLPRVLCVDDEPNILSSLRRLFRGKGFDIRTAESAAAGLAMLEQEAADLVISDMRMPEMDGARFLEQVRLRWPDSIRLLLTGHSDIGAIIDAINRGEIYRYITKPWDDEDILLIVRQALEHRALSLEKNRLETLASRQNEELQVLNASLEAKVELRTREISVTNESLHSANEKLKASFVASIKAFSHLIEMRAGYLAGHSRRVADLARRLAQKLELDNAQVQEIFIAGLLHEIGKLGFSDELLGTPVAIMKPHQLEAYRKHPVQAAQVLAAIPDLKGAANIIGTQLEHFDGTGVPGRLTGQAIPIGARILSLASDYDNMQIGALTQRRLTAEEARSIVVQSSEKLYDPNVVAALEELLGAVARQAEHAASEPQAIQETPISTRNLHVGMVLSRNLISDGGLRMLSAGHLLDEHMIQKIMDFEQRCGVRLTPYIRVDQMA